MATESRVDLAPGYSISRLLKGGWQLAGGHGAVNAESAIADMQAFVDAGITTFDCADIYTGVEALIGRYLATVRARAGAEAASDIQVHTKCVPDLGALPGLTRAQVEAAVDRSRARLGVEALDVVQLHDCFTLTEMLTYEDLGLCKKGEAKEHVQSGTFELTGELPVNTDGGLKTFGHPTGATGVRMIYENVLQLRGQAGPRQVKNATLALSHNIGGAPQTCGIAILGMP